MSLEMFDYLDKTEKEENQKDGEKGKKYEVKDINKKNINNIPEDFDFDEFNKKVEESFQKFMEENNNFVNKSITEKTMQYLFNRWLDGEINKLDAQKYSEIEKKVIRPTNFELNNLDADMQKGEGGGDVIDVNGEIINKQAYLKGVVNSWIQPMKDSPFKPKIENPVDGIKDGIKEVRESLDGKGQDTIPGFTTKDFDMSLIGPNTISCTFKSEKGDVEVNISNFVNQVEGEEKKDMTVNVLGNPDNILDSEGKKIFPNGINLGNSDDMVKLISYINEKVNDIESYIYSSVDKQNSDSEEQEIQRDKDVDFIILQNRESFLEKNQTTSEDLLKLVIEGKGFSKDTNLRKTLVALTVLMRSFSTNEIEKMLNNQSYEETLDSNTQKDAHNKNDVYSGAHIIEYLSGHMDLIGDEKLLLIAQNYINSDNYKNSQEYKKLFTKDEDFIFTNMFLQPKINENDKRIGE